MQKAKKSRRTIKTKKDEKKGKKSDHLLYSAYKLGTSDKQIRNSRKIRKCGKMFQTLYKTENF